VELPAVPVLLPDVLPAVPGVVLQGPPCGPVVLGVVVEGWVVLPGVLVEFAPRVP
jgi:hypothetical protein